QEIKQRLLTTMPEVARHFQLTLAELESPSFYRYQEGDFFGIHKDVIEPDLPGSRFEKNRKVSLILFLNSFAEAPSQNSFSEGTLTLYGLLKDPRSQNFGFPLEPEQGVLIGFPAEVWHEVKPVTRGERFTIVSLVYLGANPVAF
ncbi:MAG: 2OG-Fe(II) oxygenase, partial [Acaryochloridaceae cyanobacterium CSU_5_19]|nr:2OG-Fe(II) oxygenase [Acaryochloridaceae cyanobacterium CSU_5_19]